MGREMPRTSEVLAKAEAVAKAEVEPSRFVRGWDRLVEKFSPIRGVRRRQARIKLRTARVAETMAAYFESAGSGRLQRGRTGLGGPADRHLANATLWRIREKCRHQAVNNPLAMGIHQTDLDNTIGTGHEVQLQTNDDTWNEEAEAFLNDTLIDARGILSNGEWQRMWYGSARRDGDVGGVLVNGQVLTVEADQICTPMKLRTTVTNGILFDRIGRPLEYFVATEHPTSSYCEKAKPYKARDFAFLCRPHRYSASRGLPLASPILDMLDRIEDYVDANIIAAQVGACKGNWIRTSNSPIARGSAETNAATGAEERWEGMEPGQTLYLGLDEETGQLDPTFPPQQFDTFLNALARFCGRHIGLPLELVFLNFAKSNFSNTKAALQQAFRTFMGNQAWFDYDPRGGLLRVHRYLLAWAIKHGKFAAHPADKDGGARAWWNKLHYNAMKWPYLDRKKDNDAELQELGAGITTLQILAASRKEDWQKLQDQRHKELTRELELALKRAVVEQKIAALLAPPKPEGEPADADAE